MTNKPYSASTNIQGQAFVSGPGDGLSYYSGHLWPSLTFGKKEKFGEDDIQASKAAETAANIANIAYEQGYLKAQADIRKALGL